MDSGNSGSIQSSSGGDEEYDSRAADTISAFISTGGPSIPNPPPPPVFDPLSNYLQLYQNSSTPLLNSNTSWATPTTLRSHTDYSENRDIFNKPMFHNSPSTFRPPAVIGTDHNNQNLTAAPPPQAAPRNTRKRSRASRRAPTTVLTTDTTNFRAMVQEFTGIPAPPFNNSAFPRSRLDFFGTRSPSLDTAMPPPYLRRPFAQKVQSPPPSSFLGSSSSLLSSTALDAVAASSTTDNGSTLITSTNCNSAANSSSINYQLPTTQSPNLFNIPNPLTNSLLHTNPRFSFSDSPHFIVGSKPQQGSSFGNIGLDGLGLCHGNNLTPTLTGLPNLISPDQIPQNNHIKDTDNSNAGSWKNTADEGDHVHQAHITPINGNYNISRNTMANGEKGPENVVTTRGEGIVESWICSSD